MAADVSGKLVDKLDNLHWLHNSEGKRAITPTHGKFRRTAKCRAHSNAAGARLRLLKVLLLEFALVHCGFHEMLTWPPEATVTG
jgi:hypothetical protein